MAGAHGISGVSVALPLRRALQMTIPTTSLKSVSNGDRFSRQAIRGCWQGCRLAHGCSAADGRRSASSPAYVCRALSGGRG
jgi:hypothetical protein